jgi:hypothetical protein
VGTALASPDDVLAASLVDQMWWLWFFNMGQADLWVAIHPEALAADRVASQVRPVVRG